MLTKRAPPKKSLTPQSGSTFVNLKSGIKFWCSSSPGTGLFLPKSGQKVFVRLYSGGVQSQKLTWKWPHLRSRAQGTPRNLESKTPGVASSSHSYYTDSPSKKQKKVNLTFGSWIDHFCQKPFAFRSPKEILTHYFRGVFGVRELAVNIIFLKIQNWLLAAEEWGVNLEMGLNIL